MMALTEKDKERVAEAVHRMIAELRAQPTQEKEDALGLEIANLPPEEREHVSVVLLGLVADGLAERRGG